MSKQSREEFARIIENFQSELKSNQYFAEYFDRFASNESRKLCNEKGWFICQGAFDTNNCDRVHTINPYASKDTRVLFSTWNLDHR